MNIPYVTTIRNNYIGTIFCVVTFASPAQDGFDGALWHTYNEEGDVISYGYSKGRKGTGQGAALMAMDNARRSARRSMVDAFKEYCQLIG